MSDVAIRVEGLGKRYRIGARQARYRTLRETLTDVASSPLRRMRSTFQRSNVQRANADHIWALKDVSFEVKRGEVVGIIGRNGAGKSTLLKILSHITEPTEGGVDIYGRVGSLLEVGTGFHPELTGRENVYLNGAILGMRRAEIQAKFDEIVAFAEVDRFIDTPVKHYSSGMYVRLAFAVAAHLEPEILLVDEVLAVGDAQFQKKCLGKMSSVAGEGRTVLFVSHNMSAVSRLCRTAMHLDSGLLVEQCDTRTAVSHYLASMTAAENSREWTQAQTAPGDEFVRILSLRLLDLHGRPIGNLHQDRPFVVSIGYTVLKPMPNAYVGFHLETQDGVTLFSSCDADNPDWAGRGRAPGTYVSECIVPGHLLNEGLFYITLRAGVAFVKTCARVDEALQLQVGRSTSADGPGQWLGTPRPGPLCPRLAWRIHSSGAV